MFAYVVGTMVAAGCLGLGLRRVGAAYLRFRGTRVISCPETQEPAAVEVAAGRSAATAIFRKPTLRLRHCSRWPHNCAQECLKQIEAAPEECRIGTILANWYQGKPCICCGRALGEIRWTPHKPSVMTPQRRMIEWRDVRPETIPQLLETSSPVCWNCLVAETHTS